MGRQRKSFIRPSDKRDARLIVIATEGRKSEKQYFEGIKENYRNHGVYIKVIDKSTNARSPKKILGMLNEFEDEYIIEDKDELWMVIDIDDWEQRNLSFCNSKCKQKGYNLASSNPCFELWLLLHLKDVDNYSPEEKEELKENNKNGHTKTKLERELTHILGGYNKSNIPLKIFIEKKKISQAIDRAEVLDDPNEDWPNDLGTKVHLLVKKLVNNN